jgi:hypothetical protein
MPVFFYPLITGDSSALWWDFFRPSISRFAKNSLTLIFAFRYIYYINSEQAGSPRSSRPGHMKAGMIRL